MIGLAILMLGIGSESYAEMKRWEWDDEPYLPSTRRDVVWINGAYKLAELSEEENIALGNTAKDDFGLRVPLTDGKIDLIVSEWISNSPNVFGRNFVVDLGQNRAITKVRVIPGQTALNQPEYFVRGYRIEAAHENSRDVWRLLAEQTKHFNLVLDTQADSSWKVTDDVGLSTYREARYVRLTITRQDRSNWVALGDIEVYGTGYHAHGDLQFDFGAKQPVNIGRIVWEADVPDGTDLRMKAKGVSVDNLDWAEVPSLAQRDQYTGVEPVEDLEFKVEFETKAAFSTPRLDKLKIDYDPTLVASYVICHIEPNKIQRKEIAEVKYIIDAMVGSDDYGIDWIEIKNSIFEDIGIEIDGMMLTSAEYEIMADVDLNRTRIELLSTIRQDSRIEITGKTRLFVDTELRASVGNRVQAERDGYINWQNTTENPLGSWDLQVVGAPGDLLSSIRQSGSVISPGSADESSISFEFDVDNISSATEISIEIYSMNGIRVKRLSEFGTAGVYRFDWDGSSESEKIVPPGLYMYQVVVEGAGVSGRRRGTCVVAY
ncbi:MAG: FlgD immunoglobulin-like domain containing protein [Candidatus Latescibacterota bacterium]|nr:FlgD immunoglobulin-like domain containing protein [Candidatus Latescibacterota bacterium]